MSYVFTAEQMCLQRLARSTWERKGTAKRVGLPFGEETATENFLLDLAVQYPGRVTIVPFNKPQEGKIGADWAWSFESADSSYSFPMMVQAKILDDQDLEYTEIKRKVGSTTIRQIDRLIEVAERLGFPAFYAFYNHLEDVSRIPSVCRSLGVTKPAPLPDAWGISVAEAEQVRRALDDQSFDLHCRHSIPLHCLLCSGGNGRRGAFGSPGLIENAFRWRFPRTADSAIGPRPRDPAGLRQGSHPIFKVAIDYAREGRFYPSKIIERLKDEFPGVDGVVVFRDSEAE